MRPRRKAAAFTLLELVVVMAVLLVLAGGAIGFVTAAERNVRERRTRARFVELAAALRAFVGDTGAWPLTLDELAVNTRGLAGWRGPYARTDEVTRAGVTVRDYRVDAWGRALAWSPPGARTMDGVTFTAAQLQSSGEDYTFGTVDDLSHLLSLRPERDRYERITRERVARVNDAIGAYQRFGVTAGSPLDDSAGNTLARLRAAGYVRGAPPSPADRDDAWGQSFYMDGLLLHSRMLLSGSEPVGGKL